MKVESWVNSAGFGRGGRLYPFLFLTVGMLLWLWPIGCGGKMPVGGDVTQFFLGLMAVLGAALREGRLPIWNDLWGFGFPGIGESQMGVYYPPHLILYGFLPTEYAYVASLLLHTLWGALGAWWAARRFGISPSGSSLAAFAFAASGFFVIHMPHPWGYTTGSWMPWAWGLTWSLLTVPGPGVALRALLLTLVLVLQVLPGHFQLAFLTQFGIAVMLVWFVVEASLWRGTIEDSASERPTVLKRSSVLAIGACLLAVFPLAALQVWPTARLARLASAQRDYSYLSGFAATPWHLVNYVAPGLFHRSPLWRPLVWDPLHTSPEEQLGYVGLVPLFLAFLVITHEFRRDRAVRILAVVAGVTLVLSLGPYVPGFRLLIHLPGFSFFRAPARWSLPAALALAILAGKGLDRCLEWPRPGRSLAWLGGLSVLWVLIVVGLIELALAAGSSSRNAWLADLFERAFQTRPWTDDPGFRNVLAAARKPVVESRIPTEVVQLGLSRRPTVPTTFARSRGAIYLRELYVTAGLLLGILIVAMATAPASRRAGLPAGLMVLTFVDLMILGRYRLVDVGPLRPLVDQSPVLARLAKEPRGTRLIERSRSNLPMLIGLGTVDAYRTLDLPGMGPLNYLARGPLSSDRRGAGTRKAMRAAGAGVRLLDPVESAIERRLATSKPGQEDSDTIDDPVLARWIFGPEWNPDQEAWSSQFQIIRPESEPHRAWFLPLTALTRPAILESWDGDIEPLLALFDQAVPLQDESQGTERMDVSVDADAPGWVIVSQLADPQWRARWRDRDGTGASAAEILPAFRRKPNAGGWQRVRVPGPGRWTLHLEYEASDVTEGLAISGVSWLVWCLVVGSVVVWERRKDKS